MQHKTQQAVVLPVTFAYSAINTSDTTCKSSIFFFHHMQQSYLSDGRTGNDWYNACGHIWPGTVRPDLKLKLLLKMSIVGLTKKPLTSTLISGVTCPVELGADNA